MDEQEFWALIEVSLEQSVDSKGFFLGNAYQKHFLIDELVKLPRQSIVDFECHYRKKVLALDHYQVMAALFAIEGSVTDDPFLYFRFWIIMQGKRIYEEVVENPDSLASALQRNKDIEGELFMDLADAAYLKKVEDRYNQADLPSYVCSHLPLGSYNPQGEDWEEEDVPEICPILWQLSNTES